jgi:hypothetical protein
MIVTKVARTWATLRCRLLGRADFARWADPESFETGWIGRTHLAVSLVPPGARIIEFGAGLRQMENLLPSGMAYVPSDVIDRGPGTRVIDLNARPLPPVDGMDTAVLCGVLEYVVDVPAVVSWLSQWATSCIASYNCAATARGTLSRVSESARRARSGWVNTWSETEIRAIFLNAGFTLVERRTWDGGGDYEPVFLFQRPVPMHSQQASARTR